MSHFNISPNRALHRRLDRFEVRFFRVLHRESVGCSLFSVLHGLPSITRHDLAFFIPCNIPLVSSPNAHVLHGDGFSISTITLKPYTVRH